MCGACSTNWKEEKHIQSPGGKSEGTRLLGRSRSRWEDNIKIDLNEIEWEGVGWIRVMTFASYRLVTGSYRGSWREI
jgi:hypothetical protein